MNKRGPKREDPRERLQRFVREDLSSGCLIFTGGTSDQGYGRFEVWFGKKREQLAHRVAYRLAGKKIPRGWEVDHLCFNPPCVKVEHLQAVPKKTNIKRAIKAGRLGANMREKTRCPKRHRYTEANTYVDAKGSRHCRRCREAVWKEQNAKAKAERNAEGRVHHSERTHCRQGHPLEGIRKAANTTTGFSRYCLVCNRQRVSAVHDRMRL